MSALQVQSPWRDGLRMAGTEGTYGYKVITVTAVGRVGVREFVPGHFRVRVEPTHVGLVPLFARIFAPEKRWKQPNSSQLRFSIVVDNVEDKDAAVELASAFLVSLAAGGASVSPRRRRLVVVLVTALVAGLIVRQVLRRKA